MASFSSLSSDARDVPAVALPAVALPAVDLPAVDWPARTALRRARASIGAAQRAPSAGEGPAVLRLRMLELAHALRMGAIDVEARAEADAALAALRHAVLSRPSITFADAEARARTLDRRP
jgi:hypothetical protein